MKRFILPLVLAFIVIAAFLKHTNNETITYRVENKNHKLLVADNPQEWAEGLMNVRKLENADGMIFIFPHKLQRTFWNQNTPVDLDVYWLEDDKVIGKSFLPSIEKSKKIVTVTSPKAVDKVVELIR